MKPIELYVDTDYANSLYFINNNYSKYSVSPMNDNQLNYQKNINKNLSENKKRKNDDNQNISNKKICF